MENNGRIVALTSCDKEFIVAALTDDGTTWLLGADTWEEADRTARGLPGSRVSVGMAGPGSAVVRAKVLSPAKAALARRAVRSAQAGGADGPGQSPERGYVASGSASVLPGDPRFLISGV